jgi:hypothetical protein
MQKSESSEIKALSITYLALLIGQVILALVFIIPVYSSGFSRAPSNGYLFIFLSLTSGVAAFFGGSMQFRKKLEQINGNMKPVSEKFIDYRNACINRWALMEFAVLFSLILFFVSKYSVIFVIAVVFLLSFITLKPSLQKAASDLNISEIEIQQLNRDTSSPE